jgi:acetate kinase
MMTVLTLNSGSSSLKFGIYRVHQGAPTAQVSGEVETLGERGYTIRATDAAGRTLIDETAETMEPAAVLDRLGAWLEQAGLPGPDAIGHRIVHGGPKLRHHRLVDDAVLEALDAAIVFAPLHMPQALAVLRDARAHFPGLPQAVCFDTAFHADMPEVARTLPLPNALRERGIQRYGFHGLSYESIVRQLGPDIADRIVIAHLGNGASVTAVEAGRSIDTSMGLTPSGGVIMGTRTGDIDPGVLVYLMRDEQLEADELEDVIDRQSGLAGLSGISSDMRRLNAAASTVPAARLALEMFRISVAKQIAGMIVSLGGIDLLVFTGGIGENDVRAREGIVQRLSCCGLRPECDEDASLPRKAGDRPPRVRVLPSREDDEIARHTARLIGGS